MWKKYCKQSIISSISQAEDSFEPRHSLRIKVSSMQYITYKICSKVFINSIIHISKVHSQKVQKSKVVFIKIFKNLKQSMEKDENKIKKYAYYDFLRADAPGT